MGRLLSGDNGRLFLFICSLLAVLFSLLRFWAFRLKPSGFAGLGTRVQIAELFPLQSLTHTQAPLGFY